MTAQTAEAKNPTTWSSRARTIFSRSGLLFGLIILFALLWLFAPNFATQRNLFNVLRAISINGMIACAMTFVIISGDIDVSVGSAVAWASSPARRVGDQAALAPDWGGALCPGLGDAHPQHSRWDPCASGASPRSW